MQAFNQSSCMVNFVKVFNEFFERTQNSQKNSELAHYSNVHYVTKKVILRESELSTIETKRKYVCKRFLITDRT